MQVLANTILFTYKHIPGISYKNIQMYTKEYIQGLDKVYITLIKDLNTQKVYYKNYIFILKNFIDFMGKRKGQVNINRKIQPKQGGERWLFPQKVTFKDKDGSKHIQRSYSKESS